MRTVFVNGCFDVIHVGHVRLLRYARSLGDVLFVGVNGDSSVSRLKGPSRPVNQLIDRMEVVQAIVPDAIVKSFLEDTPIVLLSLVRPDIFVVGDEPHKRGIPEERVVESWGGRVVRFPYVVGRSTTNILNRGGSR